MIRIQNFNSLVKALFPLVLAVAGFGCVPQDVPITSDTTSTATTYQGFTGILSAHTTGATKVQITWSASNDPNVVAYNIYDISNMFTPTLIKTVAIPATGVSLTNQNNANLITYRVRAASAQNVEDSNTLSARAIPYAGVISATVTSGTTATLTYNDGSNADQIDVYCATNGSTNYSLVKTVTNVVPTQTNLTGLVSGTLYTCRVALQINGFIDDNTQTVSFTPIGQATQLVYKTQPGSSVAGVALSPQPVVEIRDVNNNVITAGPDATALITLTVSTNSPTIGTVSGTATVTAVHGVATFSGLNIQEAGIKILTATKSDTSAQTYGSGVLTADSGTFTISPGPVSPTLSTITVSPAGPLVANGGGMNGTYTISIVLKDQYGNPISGIKPTVASSNSGDTLSQPTVTTNAVGTTTGSISATVAGTRTLSITSPAGLTTVTTNAVFVAGGATKLAFIVQPVNSPSGAGGLNQIQVAIEDSQGNIVTSDSTSSLTLGITANPNSGALLGTITATAVNGVATFVGLGIDKIGNGYKLGAVSSPTTYTQASSNSFNMLAGTPAKLSLSGPSTLLSGNCSTAYTLQLQDSGGNPSNATTTTTISLTGLGSGAFYLSPSCSGPAIGASIQFATGTNTKTIYYKDMKAQSLTLTAHDNSGLIGVDGTQALKTLPVQIALSGPTSVLAGQCSVAFMIATSGADSTPGNVNANTTVQVSGLVGSSGNLYSDSACGTTALDPTNLTVTSGTSFANIYFKDSKSETLTLNVIDPSGTMTTTTAGVTISVLASNIGFTGATSVVSGTCSLAYTVTLKDASGNPVSAPADTTLSLNGLAGKNGAFYSSGACAGSPLGNSVVISQNTSSTPIYFKDNSAEVLSLFISDPAAKLANSATINLAVSPSALQIVGPNPANAPTNTCAGPFTINTLDGSSSITGAVNPITVDLSGNGTSATFYSDSACATPVTGFTFGTGVSAQTFYFSGLYPAIGGNSLNLTATDHAAVLTAGTFNWTITAAPAWIGTGAGSGGGGTATLGAGSPFTWQTGKFPVSSRADAPASVRGLHFDSTHQYLYVVDWGGQRILKYDYQNQQYIGWIGLFVKLGGIGLTGGNQYTDPTTGQPYVSAAASAQCAGSPSTVVTPGWCQGGQSSVSSSYISYYSNTGGAMYYPSSVTDDGNYIYVTNYYGSTVQRFDAVTGKFLGWIGRIYLNAGMTAGIDNQGNNVGTCSASSPIDTITPGWCKGGVNYNTTYGASSTSTKSLYFGDGALYLPTAVASSNTGHFYVAQYGSINKYNSATGAFEGWIGQVNATSVTVASTAHPLAPGTGMSNTCATTSTGSQTPGWCMWGTMSLSASGTGGIDQPWGLYVDDTNQYLYVVQSDSSGTINQYNLATGAFIKHIVYGGTPIALVGPSQVTFDGTYFFIADSTRVAKVDPTSGILWGWLGKVGNNGSMSDATGNAGAGCSTLSINSDTPGFCLGGSARQGMDEKSVHTVTAIENDGQGNIITGQGATFPAIKKWSATTGDYGGMLTNADNSPTQWTVSQSPAGLYGYGDNSMMSPLGIYNDGTYAYVADSSAERIKKISLATGATVGWIGGVGGFLDGVTPLSGCGNYSIGFTTGWCLGAFFSPSYLWGSLAPIYGTTGTMNLPYDVTGDGTNLYVADYGTHRILRFDQVTGAYKGWLGGIGGTTTGPATGSDSSLCTGAVPGQFTPGWCIGGSPAAGTGNGYMTNPSNIMVSGGKLYVVDYGNSRVNSYNATTGAFIGWIGRVNLSAGMSPAAVNKTNTSSVTYTYTNGWSTGGTPQIAAYTGSTTVDSGGGFYFTGTGGLATDGTYLYVANSLLSRIDRFNLSTGIYAGSARTHYSYYTNVWTDPSKWTNWGGAGTAGSSVWYWEGYNAHGLWVDGNYIYFASGSGYGAAVKMNKTTGSIVGWQGGLSSAPTGPNSTCTGATGVAPGFCQGGGLAQGYSLGNTNSPGGYSGANYGITGDANFVYITDQSTNRITRIPK